MFGNKVVNESNISIRPSLSFGGSVPGEVRRWVVRGSHSISRACTHTNTHTHSVNRTEAHIRNKDCYGRKSIIAVLPIHPWPGWQAGRQAGRQPGQQQSHQHHSFLVIHFNIGLLCVARSTNFVFLSRCPKCKHKIVLCRFTLFCFCMYSIMCVSPCPIFHIFVLRPYTRITYKRWRRTYYWGDNGNSPMCVCAASYTHCQKVSFPRHWVCKSYQTRPEYLFDIRLFGSTKWYMNNRIGRQCQHCHSANWQVDWGWPHTWHCPNRKTGLSQRAHTHIHSLEYVMICIIG